MAATRGLRSSTPWGVYVYYVCGFVLSPHPLECRVETSLCPCGETVWFSATELTPNTRLMLELVMETTLSRLGKLRPSCKLHTLDWDTWKECSDSLSLSGQCNIWANIKLESPNISVVSVANVSFKWTNLFSERSERDHFMDWFVPFSVELSSATIMLAGSGTAATHTENCEDVILVHALCWKWCCVSQPGQRRWFTFSNHTAKISAVLLTSV